MRCQASITSGSGARPALSRRARNDLVNADRSSQLPATASRSRSRRTSVPHNSSDGTAPCPRSFAATPSTEYARIGDNRTSTHAACPLRTRMAAIEGPTTKPPSLCRPSTSSTTTSCPANSTTTATAVVAAARKSNPTPPTSRNPIIAAPGPAADGPAISQPTPGVQPKSANPTGSGYGRTSPRLSPFGAVVRFGRPPQLLAGQALTDAQGFILACRPVNRGGPGFPRVQPDTVSDLGTAAVVIALGAVSGCAGAQSSGYDEPTLPHDVDAITTLGVTASKPLVATVVLQLAGEGRPQNHSPATATEPRTTRIPRRAKPRGSAWGAKPTNSARPKTGRPGRGPGTKPARRPATRDGQTREGDQGRSQRTTHDPRRANPGGGSGGRSQRTTHDPRRADLVGGPGAKPSGWGLGASPPKNTRNPPKRRALCASTRLRGWS